MALKLTTHNLSVCLCVRMSVCLCVCLCVCGTGANVNASNPNCIGDIEEEEKTKLQTEQWTPRRPDVVLVLIALPLLLQLSQLLLLLLLLKSNKNCCHAEFFNGFLAICKLNLVALSHSLSFSLYGNHFGNSNGEIAQIATVTAARDLCKAMTLSQ